MVCISSTTVLLTTPTQPTLVYTSFQHIVYVKYVLTFHALYFVKGAYFAWKATAMGKNYVNGKTFLEKR